MSDSCAPYTDADGCTVYPTCPAIASVPASIGRVPILGWNAGANSIDELNGNVHTVFTLPIADAGVVIGLRSDRARQTLPDLIEHGLYFASLGGVSLVHVVERAVARTAPVPRGAEDTFEIRRVGTRVTYWHNKRLMHMSAARSTGAKIINTCLYASGDTV